MRILVVGAFIGILGLVPVYAYDKVVQPQLDALESMYSSMDQTAEDIAAGKNVEETKTYQYGEVLSSGWQPER